MKILVIVDMQNDFINGSLGTTEAQAIVPNVCKLIEDRADENTIILFTKDTHTNNYLDSLEGKNLSVEHCIYETSGWEINNDVYKTFLANKHKYSLLNPNGNYVILKPTFGSIDLQNALLYIDESIEAIEDITFAGLCTGICVLSNAMLAKASLPEVPVNVVENCCACVSPETHKTALEAMKLCQINII